MTGVAGTATILVGLLGVALLVALVAERIRVPSAVALVAFLLLRLAHTAQRAVHSLLTFTRLVRANLMHRRPINSLLLPPPPIIKDQRQLSLSLCQI